MCEPATATAILLAASTGMKAVGAIQQGAAEQTAANYNKKVARAQASQEREKAAFDEARSRNANEFQLQDMAADWAKSGLRLDSGTPLEMMARSAGEMETDALLIRREGQIKAKYYDAEAAMANKRGRAAMSAGLMGSAISVLDGAAKWKGMQ
jgi:hypothetical protein